MRLIRNLIATLIFAVLGAAAGRWLSAQRRGETASFDLAALRPTVREVMPGLIAALRASERPWSYLHLPGWLAAFAVNLATGAFASELAPWLRALGINGGSNEASDDLDGRDDRGDGAFGAGFEAPEPWSTSASASASSTRSTVRTEVWTSEVPLASETPEPTPGFRPFAN